MSNNVRDKSGRFAAGNPGGPGRPRLSAELQRLRALSESVTMEDWLKIIASARRQAMRGDHKAREWLSRYLLPDDPHSFRSKLAMLLAGYSHEPHPTADSYKSARKLMNEIESATEPVE